MLSKVFEIPNSKNIIKIESSLFYGTDHDLVELDLNGNLIGKFQTKEQVYKLLKIGESILVINDIDQIIDVPDCKRCINILINSEKDVRISSVTENRYIQYYTTGDKSISGFFDIKTQSSIFESDIYFGTNLYGDYIIDTGKFLKVLEISSGQIILEIDTKNIYGVERFDKILGVRENKVIAMMSDGSLFVVDMISKKYNVWKAFDNEYLSHKTLETETPKSRLKSEMGIFSGRSAILLKNFNKVIGFEYGVFWELNLDTNNLQAESLYEEFNSKNVSGCWSASVVDGDNLYFFSDQSFSENQNHKIVEFNLKSKEIVSQWSLPQTKARSGFAISGPILMGQNFIAAISQNSVCHMFIDNGQETLIT